MTTIGSPEDESHERLHSVPIDAGAAAVGKRLADLELDSVGAEVTAVRRRGIRGADPSPEMTLQVGDVVVLRGVPESWNWPRKGCSAVTRSCGVLVAIGSHCLPVRARVPSR